MAKAFRQWVTATDRDLTPFSANGTAKHVWECHSPDQVQLIVEAVAGMKAQGENINNVHISKSKPWFNPDTNTVAYRKFEDLDREAYELLAKRGREALK